MTCIIGIASEGNVWIGGDSASVRGYETRVTKIPKVFRVQEFLIGYTSSFRMGQILQYHLETPTQENQEDLEYLVTKFIPAVRSCLKEHWFSTLPDKDGQGGRFLVGYKGHLYAIYSDFQVNESSDGFEACGSGREYALGATQALSYLSPRVRIQQALNTVSHFSHAVCAPFRVLSLE